MVNQTGLTRPDAPMQARPSGCVLSERLDFGKGLYVEASPLLRRANDIRETRKRRNIRGGWEDAVVQDHVDADNVRLGAFQRGLEIGLGFTVGGEVVDEERLGPRIEGALALRKPIEAPCLFQGDDQRQVETMRGQGCEGTPANSHPATCSNASPYAVLIPSNISSIKWPRASGSEIKHFRSMKTGSPNPRRRRKARRPCVHVPRRRPI